ncbi:MAG TPA: class I SAM-dependent methyltransferase [Ilumatobacteraceae bacterium]|nr:class I SAM-dependent methyltransferase [Ilumatobacteraceae bacterium]
MDEIAPADFYTGIVVDVYGPLKGAVPDPRIYSGFIGAWGEPALELGCGDGDPLLTLRADGLDVEGLDSSADMLAKLQRSAADRGIDVVVHHSTIEQMDLGRMYRSIFLAGPTFNLLPDDATAASALERIREHLDPAGAALIPLFIPAPVPDNHLGIVREHIDDRGRILRVSAISVERNDTARCQTTVLRYEVVDGDDNQVVERPWVLHWHTQQGFRELVANAGLNASAVFATDGSPAPHDASEFAFVLRRSDRPAADR